MAVAAMAGAIALRLLPSEQRHRVGRAIGDWTERKMIHHMVCMMASLPEGAPPKLIASILPKLQALNVQISESRTNFFGKAAEDYDLISLLAGPRKEWMPSAMAMTAPSASAGWEAPRRPVAAPDQETAPSYD